MESEQPGRPTELAINDGQLTLRVKRAEGEETRHVVDLLLLKLTCEQCEERHKLTEKDGRLSPTPEFLTELAAMLSGIGLERCTPTLAWQAWVAASDAMAMLKKSMS